MSGKTAREVKLQLYADCLTEVAAKFEAKGHTRVSTNQLRQMASMFYDIAILGFSPGLD